MRSASLTLASVMLGAVCTHAVHGELPRVIPPLVLGRLAFLIHRSQRTAGR